MAAHFSRSASLMGFFELVKELGGDPQDLLASCAIPSAWLDTDDNLIPSEKLAELLERSASSLACEDFGMRLARLQSLSMLGPVGLLVQQCETLGEALSQLQRFLYIHSQAGLLQVDTRQDTCLVSFAPLVSYEGRDRQLIDLTLMAGLSMLSELAHRTIPLQHVYFSYRRPDNLEPYRQVFGSGVQFEAEVSGVALPASVLNWPLKPERARIQALVQRYISSIEAAHPAQLESQVRALIRQLLPLGQCRLAQLASVLQLEPRTLQRRLSERGLRYRQLLSEERALLAQRYLDESEVQLSHLADLLGFSEQSVFTNSFRQWTGKSPTQYLKERGRRLKFRAGKVQV